MFNFLATTPDETKAEEIILINNLPQTQHEVTDAVKNARVTQHHYTKSTVTDEVCNVEISVNNYLNDIGKYLIHVRPSSTGKGEVYQVYAIESNGFVARWKFIIV